jgi:putative transcriptional regulator
MTGQGRGLTAAGASVDDLGPGTLLVAPPTEDDDPSFGRTVVLVVDREPHWTVAGLVLNRPLGTPAIDHAARAALFLPTIGASAYWGGPVGSDPVLLAELRPPLGSAAPDDLAWFHFDQQAQRPFPLPNLGLIALGEHHDAFEGRIARARLFVGLSIWAAVQLQREIERGDWWLAAATVDDVFDPAPETLVDRIRERRPEAGR